MSHISGAEETLPLAARQMLLPITPSDHVIKYDTVIADGKSAANGWSWQAKEGWRKTRRWTKGTSFHCFSLDSFKRFEIYSISMEI